MPDGPMSLRMDKHIASIAASEGVPDGDLTLCEPSGIAFQADMKVAANYGAEYFSMYASYENNDKADAIDGGRIALVARHAGAEEIVCDIGIGAGVFIKKRGNTFGVDVNPFAIAWLKTRGIYADDLSRFAAYTFWDVIEHLPTPADYFDKIKVGAHLFTCLPIFTDLKRIRESRHYKPGEHLTYYTEDGFVRWMSMHGFALLERDDYETQAGRDSILSFAFQKVRRG